MADPSQQQDQKAPEVELRAAEQAAKIAALRSQLESADGQKAAAQLIQGGELKALEDMLCDSYLRRWLRARRWDVDTAKRCIISHAQWRVTMMPKGAIQEADIANELACEKVYVLGCDKAGRPLVLIAAKKHNGWTRRLDELERFCCYLLDNAIALCDPETNPRGHISVLLDLTDMGALSMDVQAIQALFKLLGEHYVERLGQMVMYNPPMLFWGAWNTLSPLLPPVTREKIHVLDATKREVLVNNVDPDVLPEEYGGCAKLVPPLSRANSRVNLQTLAA